MVNPYAYGPTLRTICAGINLTGGAAAPLFITLAGVGSALGERGGKPQTTILRGALLILYGLLLNLMVPSWFSIWSFYVLHLLGVWLIVAPGVLRLRGVSVLLLATLVLGGAVLGQSLAETPQMLTNELMRSTERPGGGLRLALLESQFPIFPWLALAIGGVWAGRTVAAGRLRSLFVAAGLCGVLAGLLRGLVLVIPGAASNLPWRAVCRTGRSFFPMSTVYALSLFALCMLLLGVFVYLERKTELKPDSWLIPLGRSSLSLLIVHVVLFREGLIAAELRRNVHPTIAIMVIIAFLVGWTFLARAWGRVGYKYGAEWLLRRV